MPAIVDVRITGEINEIYYLEIHRSVLCSYPFDAVYDVLNQDELWFTRCNVRNVVGTMEDSRLPSISSSILWFYISAYRMGYFNSCEIYLSLFRAWCAWDDMVVFYSSCDWWHH